MEVFVNNERRELKVTDGVTGKDYATALICSDQVVDTDEYNRFVMSWITIFLKKRSILLKLLWL